MQPALLGTHACHDRCTCASHPLQAQVRNGPPAMVALKMVTQDNMSLVDHLGERYEVSGGAGGVCVGGGGWWSVCVGGGGEGVGE